jgi:hypothetical protein
MSILTRDPNCEFDFSLLASACYVKLPFRFALELKFPRMVTHMKNVEAAARIVLEIAIRTHQPALGETLYNRTHNR